MRAMKNASAAALVGIWTILLTAFVVTILYVGRQLLIPRRSFEANEGTLRVRDKPDSGCVFTIDLPRHAMPVGA